MNLYIYGKDNKVTDSQRIQVRELLTKEALNLSIIERSEEMVKAACEEEKTAVFILNIASDERLAALELGVKIKELSPKSLLIYISSDSELCYMTFEKKIRIYHFINPKSDEYVRQQLTDCLLRISKDFDFKKGKYFYLESNGRKRCIPFENILMFKTTDKAHKIELIHEQGTLIFYSTLRKILCELDEHFTLCHRSVVVNCDKIAQIDKKNKIVVMRDGQTCRVSDKGIRYIKERLSRQIINSNIVDQNILFEMHYFIKSLRIFSDDTWCITYSLFLILEKMFLLILLEVKNMATPENNQREPVILIDSKHRCTFPQRFQGVSRWLQAD